MSIRFRLPFSKGQSARDLDDEMALHLELRTAALIRQGLTPDAARTEATRRFGDAVTLRDEALAIDLVAHASARRWNALGELGADTAFALRSLRRERSFAAVTVLIFALGIGATTAIFSLCNGVVLHPLAVERPDRLMWISTVDNENNESVSPAAWFAWSERARTLEHLATARPASITLLGAGDPTRLTGLLVGRGFFETIRARPAVGRSLVARDYMSGAAPVVVISHSLWNRHFGGVRSVVGRPASLNGELRTIVGVMERSAEVLGEGSDFWIPDILSSALRDNWTPFLGSVGRLRDGVTSDVAQRELQTILSSADNRSERATNPLQARVVALGDYLTAPFRDRVLLLFVAVLCVLAIGCVNVANLLLARGARRERELAVRASLGASRGRLVRQLLTENLLLAVAGGLLGVLIGIWMMRGLVAILPPDLPRLAQVELDGTSLLFAGALTLATVLVSGLVPSLRTARIDLRSVLQDGGRGATGGVTHDRLRRAFVVAEVAMTAVLLVAAGLLIRSASALSRVPPGFSPDSVLTARYSLPQRGYPGATDVRAAHGRMLRALRTAVGPNVALSSKVPLDGNSGGGSDFFVYGARDTRRSDVNAALRLTTPGYFRTMGIALIAGRDFTERDGVNAPRAMIVSEGLLRRLGLGADAVGRRIAGTSSPFKDSTGAPYPWEIVGVVRDPRDWGLRNDPQPQVFLPLEQTPDEVWDWSGREMHLVARGLVSPTLLRPRLSEAVARVDPTLPLYDLLTMRQRLSASLALERANTILVVALGVAALVLALTGLYGVISYGVTQRQPEIGVRMALGAQPADILLMVGRWGAGLAGIGILCGIPLAAAAGWGLRGLLFGVSALDPLTIVAVSVLLVVVTVVSCILPARRAVQVAPESALRR